MDQKFQVGDKVYLTQVHLGSIDSSVRRAFSGVLEIIGKKCGERGAPQVRLKNKKGDVLTCTIRHLRRA